MHFDPAAFRPLALDNRQARYLGPVLSDAAGMVQAVTVDDLLPPEAQAAVSRARCRAAGSGVMMLVDEFSGLLKRKDGAGQPLDRRGRGQSAPCATA